MILSGEGISAHGSNEGALGAKTTPALRGVVFSHGGRGHGRLEGCLFSSLVFPAFVVNEG